jgi:hypothetical protein
MDPLWRDKSELSAELKDVIGAEKVEEYYFANAPLRGILGPFRRRRYQPPPPGCPVLVLSDLGIGGPRLRGDRSHPEEWLAFARRLKAQGSRVAVLVPYPRHRWSRVLESKMALIQWDRRTTVADVYRANEEAETQ